MSICGAGACPSRWGPRRMPRPPSAWWSTATPGLALYGIDPVAYFTDKKPVAGRPDVELTYAGAVWRFGNEGNRAAFAADPEVYMPRFGGYDPVGISHGLATPGYPALWVVHDERLYLFYTADARAAFIASPAAVIAPAAARWSTVKSELAE